MYVRTNRAAESLCEHLSLFDFCGVHLRADHRTKRHFCAKFVRNGQCERSLTRAWRTNEEKRATRELAGLYEFDGHPTCLMVV